MLQICTVHCRLHNEVLCLYALYRDLGVQTAVLGLCKTLYLSDSLFIIVTYASRPRRSAVSFLLRQCGRQPFLCTPISTCPVMAPKPTGDGKRDKFMRFLHLRPRAPQSTESSIDIQATQRPITPLLPPQLAGTIEPPVLNPHDIEPTSTKLEKVFTKGKSFKRDMAMLAIAYTLQQKPELKRLIHLIVVIRDNDSEGQVMSAMYHAYRSPTVLSFSLPKFSKPALGSVFNLHLLPMPSVQKRHRR